MYHTPLTVYSDGCHGDVLNEIEKMYKDEEKYKWHERPEGGWTEETLPNYDGIYHDMVLWADKYCNYTNLGYYSMEMDLVESTTSIMYHPIAWCYIKPFERACMDD